MPDPPWHSRNRREQSRPCLSPWVSAESHGAQATRSLLRSTGGTRARRLLRKRRACACEETCAPGIARPAETRAPADAPCIFVYRLRTQPPKSIAAPALFPEPSSRSCSGRHARGGAEKPGPSDGARQYRPLPCPLSSAFAKAAGLLLRG